MKPQHLTNARDKTDVSDGEWRHGCALKSHSPHESNKTRTKIEGTPPMLHKHTLGNRNI